MSDERILMVDDNPSMVKVCAEILTEEGYRVSQACGGREALTQLERGRFDLLVIDLRMPKVDGLTVLRRARELDPDVTAIVITSYGNMQNAIDALRAGARDFLLKPFDPDDLERAVGEALAARRREQERLLLRARLPILEISQALMAEGGVETLAGRLLEVVVSQIGAEQAALLLLDQEADELHLAAAAGRPDENMAGRRFPAGEGIARQALLGQEPLVLEVSSPANLDPLWPVLNAGPDTAAACLPLRTGEKAIGLLTVSRAERAGSAPFSPAELNLLSIMGSQITGALENARLYEALRRELAERVRAESHRDASLKALRESEQRLAVALKNAPMVVAHVDKDLRYTWIHNPHPDFKPEDVIGKRDDQLAKTEGTFRLVELKRQVLDGGIPARREISFILSDGERAYDIYAEPKSDSIGKIIGLTTTALDITERKRAESQRDATLKALRESEARLELAIAGLNGGEWHYKMNPDDPLHALPDDVYLSPRLKRFIGYEDDEFPNSLAAWESQIVPEDLPVLRESSRNHRAGRTNSYELEYRIRHKDGSLRWINSRGRVQRDEDGRPIRFAGIDWDITEGKRAEAAEERHREALKRSHRDLTMAQRVTHTGSWTFDLATSEVTWSEEMFRIFGLDAADGPPSWPDAHQPLYHPDDWLLSKDLIEKAIARGESYQLENRIVRGDDGSVRHTAAGGNPIRSADGHVMEYVGTVQDITERVRAEEALRASEERFRIALKHSPIVVFNQDRELRYTWVYNPDPRVSAETVLGKTDAELFSPEEASRLAEIKLRVLETGVGVQEEASTTINGVTFFFDVTIEPLCDSAGVVTGITCAAMDITKRKRAESQRDATLEALRESEERYRSLFESVPVGLYRTTPDGQILDVNSVMLEMLGFPDQDTALAANAASAYANPKDRVRWQAMMEREGLVHDFQAQWRRRDGTSIWVKDTARAVADGEGRVLYYEGSLEDITERRRGDNLIRAQRDLGLALGTARGLDETLRLCLEAAIHVSEMDSGGIYLVDETSGACDIVSHQGLPPDFVKSASHFDGDSDHARLVMAGKPIYTEHLSLGVELSEAERRESLRALAVIPVRHGDRVIACLNVASHNRGEVPPHARDAIEAITAQIGSAIARTRAETQRDATLEALRESEERHRTLFEGVPVGLYRTTPDGQILDVNPALLEVTGFSDRETALEVNAVSGYANPEDRARWQALMDRDGVVRDFELEWRRYDGMTIRVNNSARAVRDAEGRVLYYEGSLEDITERKRAESQRDATLAALRDARHMLQTVLDSIPTGVFWKDRDSIYLGSNRTWMAWAGVKSLEEVVGKSDHDLPWEKKQTDSFREDDRRVMESGIPEYDMIEPYLRADGTHAWARTNKVPLRDTEGNVVGILGTSEDITERRQTEQEVARLAKFPSENPNPVLRIARDGTILYANEAGLPLLDFWGCQIGQHLPDGWSGLEVDVLTSGLTRDTEIKCGDRTLALIFAPVVEADYVNVYGLDTTERKKAEAALRRSLEETARGQRLLLALSQAAQAVQRARTAEEIYRTFGDEVVKLGYHAFVFALTHDQQYLTLRHLTIKPTLLRAAEKLTGLSLQTFRVPLVESPVFQRVLTEGETSFDEPAADFMAGGLPKRVRSLAPRIAAKLGLEQCITAPLTVSGERIGLLVVAGAGLTKADAPTITAFANQASIALENAGLVQQARTRSTDLEKLSIRLFRAQEEERRRISLELHDELGQALTAMGFDLAAIERELPPEVAPKARERLANVGSLLAEVDERVSEMALDLRPQMLDDLGLLPTLRWYVNRYTRRMGIEVELEAVDFEERVTPDVATAVYRTVQEALTNVAKHAGASRVAVRLERSESTVTAVVQDNGRGFEAEEHTAHLRERGTGLLGIQERVALLGGSFDIQSRPGQGTRLTMRIPI